VLGPFYIDAPENFPLGADLSVGSAGLPMIVTGSVTSADGQPIAGALVDIWHADEDGLYDVQHLEGLAMRGRFTTDAQGKFWFISSKPRWYPIPSDGPVGKMLAAQGRHPNRPAHVHFMIHAPGHETLVTHIFEEGDPWLDSDAVLGVKQSLVSPFVVHEPGVAPDGRQIDVPYCQLHYDFVLMTNAGGA
jgi:hydroxyquinol 1,2-dioxygenase